jgi:hypothetical protein
MYSSKKPLDPNTPPILIEESIFDSSTDTASFAMQKRGSIAFRRKAAAILEEANCLNPGCFLMNLDGKW